MGLATNQNFTGRMRLLEFSGALGIGLGIQANWRPIGYVPSMLSANDFDADVSRRRVCTNPSPY